MKTISLKFTFLIVGISILSGCYTQLSEPISREEYYTEPDTVYQYQENELSEYNLGYRDGFRDFTNDYLWYGYNPNSYFYSSHRPYWSSPWSYHHSFYLGVYDPFFYDPFWDWGYAGYYSPYSYYGYNSWYNSRHYYSHGYYYHRPHYYHSGYAGTNKVSEGREQKTAEWHSKTSGASQSTWTPKDSNSDFQNTLSLPMAAGSGKSSTASGGSQPNTQRLPEDIIKPNINSKEVKTLDVRPTKSPDEDLPGFQTTLIPPAKLETKPIKSRSTSGASPKRTITVPVKKSSAPSKTSAPSKSPSSSSSEETKTISTPKSDSGSSSSSSSKSSYSAPANSSSSNSSSGSSSGSRSSSSSSSRSGSSKSSSSESSSKSSSKKSN